jgi:hypothetical protein
MPRVTELALRVAGERDDVARGDLGLDLALGLLSFPLGLGLA